MTAISEPVLDETRIEAFAGRLFEAYSAGMLTFTIDLAHRTGLFETLAAGPGTSAELAGRAGLVERYVRECLGGLVTGGIVDYDPASRTYTLPAEHAVCLAGEGSANLAPLSQLNAMLGQHVKAVAQAFRDGGGVPYERFRPDFTDLMDAASRGLYDGQLLDGLIPQVEGLRERLERGARVADVGCGTGHAVNVMAAAFPRSTFTGYDISDSAIASARAEAAAQGSHNAAFEVLDVAQLPVDEPLDAAFAFDAIHDQVAPAAVLERIHAALAPDGVFVMMDVKASSNLEDNVGNPFAPYLYGISTLHCMTVSLAHGGAGLGTVWGEQQALQMLADAGFADVTVHEVPDDPTNSLYVARKRG